MTSVIDMMLDCYKYVANKDIFDVKSIILCEMLCDKIPSMHNDHICVFQISPNPRD